MMEWTSLFYRTILAYVIVFLTLRIMGKREIGKLSVFDLVISIMIAEIAVFSLENVNKPIIEGLIPMATLVAIQLFIAWISLKNEKLRRLFEGHPSVIIDRSGINREEMRKQRYNLDDLLVQLRENKIANLADVEFAILEPSGKLTVVEKAKEQEQKQNESIPKESLPFRYEGLPLPLIMDGKVQDDHLEKLGKTRFWLKSELKAQGIDDFKDVFFCTYDHRGKWFIDRKR